MVGHISKIFHARTTMLIEYKNNALFRQLNKYQVPNYQSILQNISIEKFVTTSL